MDNSEEIPLPIQRMVLQDRSQQYFNMLSHVHDLKPSEREKILEWMIQIDEQLANLPPITDDEVAFHPEVP